MKDLPACSELILAVDNDANGIGLERAREAARVFTEAGHKVRIALPDRPKGERKWDWNDVLCDPKENRDEMRESILNAPVFAADEKAADEARLDELALLDRIEYERQRKDAGEELGIRAAVLDNEPRSRGVPHAPTSPDRDQRGPGHRSAGELRGDGKYRWFRLA